MENNAADKKKEVRVLRLNNDYTNEQLKKQLQTPHRRYLGLILVTVILVLTVPTYGLLKSYQTLIQARATNVKTVQQSKQIEYQASSDAELIKNIQNSYYQQKFARTGPYYWSKPGEKIFTTPSSSSTTASVDDGQ